MTHGPTSHSTPSVSVASVVLSMFNVGGAKSYTLPPPDFLPGHCTSPHHTTQSFACRTFSLHFVFFFVRSRLTRHIARESPFSVTFVGMEGLSACIRNL